MPPAAANHSVTTMLPVQQLRSPVDNNVASQPQKLHFFPLPRAPYWRRVHLIGAVLPPQSAGHTMTLLNHGNTIVMIGGVHHSGGSAGASGGGGGGGGGGVNHTPNAAINTGINSDYYLIDTSRVRRQKREAMEAEAAERMEEQQELTNVNGVDSSTTLMPSRKISSPTHTSFRKPTSPYVTPTCRVLCGGPRSLNTNPTASLASIDSQHISRVAHATIRLNEHTLYTHGGWNGTKYVTSGFLFDLATQHMLFECNNTRGPAVGMNGKNVPKRILPTARRDHCLVPLFGSEKHPSAFLCFGGSDGQESMADMYVCRRVRQRKQPESEGPTPTSSPVATPAAEPSSQHASTSAAASATPSSSWIWSPISIPHTPSPRRGASLVRVHGRIYLFGGLEGYSTYRNDLHILDVQKKQSHKRFAETQAAKQRQQQRRHRLARCAWHTPSASSYSGTPPSPRAWAATMTHGPYILVYGGVGPSGVLGDLHLLDTVGKRWYALAQTGVPIPEVKRPSFNQNKSLQQPQQQQTQQPQQLLPTPRAAMAYTKVGSQLWIHGGFTNNTSNTATNNSLLIPDQELWILETHLPDVDVAAQESDGSEDESEEEEADEEYYDYDRDISPSSPPLPAGATSPIPQETLTPKKKASNAAKKAKQKKKLTPERKSGDTSEGKKEEVYVPTVKEGWLAVLQNAPGTSAPLTLTPAPSTRSSIASHLPTPSTSFTTLWVRRYARFDQHTLSLFQPESFSTIALTDGVVQVWRDVHADAMAQKQQMRKEAAAGSGSSAGGQQSQKDVSVVRLHGIDTRTDSVTDSPQFDPHDEVMEEWLRNIEAETNATVATTRSTGNSLDAASHSPAEILNKLLDPKYSKHTMFLNFLSTPAQGSGPAAVLSRTNIAADELVRVILAIDAYRLTLPQERISSADALVKRFLPTSQSKMDALLSSNVCTQLRGHMMQIRLAAQQNKQPVPTVSPRASASMNARISQLVASTTPSTSLFDTLRTAVYEKLLQEHLPRFLVQVKQQMNSGGVGGSGSSVSSAAGGAAGSKNITPNKNSSIMSMTRQRERSTSIVPNQMPHHLQQQQKGGSSANTAASTAASTSGGVGSTSGGNTLLTTRTNSSGGASQSLQLFTLKTALTDSDNHIPFCSHCLLKFPSTSSTAVLFQNKSTINKQRMFCQYCHEIFCEKCVQNQVALPGELQRLVLAAQNNSAAAAASGITNNSSSNSNTSLPTPSSPKFTPANVSRIRVCDMCEYMLTSRARTAAATTMNNDQPTTRSGSGGGGGSGVLSKKSTEDTTAIIQSSQPIRNQLYAFSFAPRDRKYPPMHLATDSIQARKEWIDAIQETICKPTTATGTTTAGDPQASRSSHHTPTSSTSILGTSPQPLSGSPPTTATGTVGSNPTRASIVINSGSASPPTHVSHSSLSLLTKQPASTSIVSVNLNVKKEGWLLLAGEDKIFKRYYCILEQGAMHFLEPMLRKTFKVSGTSNVRKETDHVHVATAASAVPASSSLAASLATATSSPLSSDPMRWPNLYPFILTDSTTLILASPHLEERDEWVEGIARDILNMAVSYTSAALISASNVNDENGADEFGISQDDDMLLRFRSASMPMIVQKQGRRPMAQIGNQVENTGPQAESQQQPLQQQPLLIRSATTPLDASAPVEPPTAAAISAPAVLPLSLPPNPPIPDDTDEEQESDDDAPPPPPPA